eukprot:359412-Chlamydomonas_euryale.AAC.4
MAAEDRHTDIGWPAGSYALWHVRASSLASVSTWLCSVGPSHIVREFVASQSRPQCCTIGRSEHAATRLIRSGSIVGCEVYVSWLGGRNGGTRGLRGTAEAVEGAC